MLIHPVQMVLIWPHLWKRIRTWTNLLSNLTFWVKKSTNLFVLKCPCSTDGRTVWREKLHQIKCMWPLTSQQVVSPILSHPAGGRGHADPHHKVLMPCRSTPTVSWTLWSWGRCFWALSCNFYYIHISSDFWNWNVCFLLWLLEQVT